MIEVAIDWDSAANLFKVVPGTTHAIVFNHFNDGLGVGATFALSSAGFSNLGQEFNIDEEDASGIAYTNNWRLTAVWTEVTTGNPAEYVRGYSGADGKQAIGFSIYIHPDKPSARIGVRIYASFER